MKLKGIFILALLLAFVSHAVYRYIPNTAITTSSDKFVYTAGDNVTITCNTNDNSNDLNLTLYLVNATNSTSILNTSFNTSFSTPTTDFGWSIIGLDTNVDSNYLVVATQNETNQSLTFKILPNRTYEFEFDHPSVISVSDVSFQFKVKVSNESGALTGEEVSLEVVPSESGIVLNQTNATTGGDGWTGWVRANVSNAIPGGYAIFVNGGQGSAPFWIESYKVFLKVLNEFGVPAKTFGQGSMVKLIAKLTTVSGDNVIGDVNFKVIAPNASIYSFNSNAVGNGVYTTDIPIPLNVSTGNYKVIAEATVGNYSQTAFDSFDISDYDMVLRFVRSKEFSFMADQIIFNSSVFPISVEIRNLGNSSLHDASDTCSNLSAEFIASNGTTSDVTSTLVNDTSSGKCVVNVTAPSDEGYYALKLTANVTIDGSARSFTSHTFVRVQDYLASLTPLDTITQKYQPSFSPGQDVLLQVSAFQQNASTRLDPSTDIINATIVSVTKEGSDVTLFTSSVYDSATGRFNVTISNGSESGVYVVTANISLTNGKELIASGPLVVKRLFVSAYTILPDGNYTSSLPSSTPLNLSIYVGGITGSLQGARVCVVSVTDTLTGYTQSVSGCGTTGPDGSLIMMLGVVNLSVGDYDIYLSVNYSGVIENATASFKIKNYPVHMEAVSGGNFSIISHIYSANEVFFMSVVPINITNLSSPVQFTNYTITRVNVNYFGTLNSPSAPVSIDVNHTLAAEDVDCPSSFGVSGNISSTCKVVSVLRSSGQWDPGIYSISLTVNTSLGTQDVETFVIVQSFGFNVEQPPYETSFYAPSDDTTNSTITLNITSEKAAVLTALLRDLDTLSVVNSSLEINDTSISENSTVERQITVPAGVSGEQIIEITATNGTDTAIGHVWIMVKKVKIDPIAPFWDVLPRNSMAPPEALGLVGWNFSPINAEAYDASTALFGGLNLGNNYAIDVNKSICFDANNDGVFDDAYCFDPGSVTNVSINGDISKNFTYSSEVTGMVMYTGTDCLEGNCGPMYNKFFGRYERNTTVPIFVRVTFPNGTVLPGGAVNVTVADLKYMTGVMGSMASVPSSDYSVVDGTVNGNGYANVTIRTNRTGIFFALLKVYFISNTSEQEFANPWDMFAFESIAYDGRTDIVQSISTFNLTETPTGTGFNYPFYFIVNGSYKFNESVEHYDLDGDGSTNKTFYFVWFHTLGNDSSMFVIDNDTTYNTTINNTWLTQPVTDNYTDVFLGGNSFAGNGRIYKITFEDLAIPTIRLHNITFSWDQPMNPTAVFYQVEYLNGTAVENITSGNFSILNAQTWETEFSANLTQPPRGFVTIPPTLADGEYLVWLKYTTLDSITAEHPRRLLKQS